MGSINESIAPNHHGVSRLVVPRSRSVHQVANVRTAVESAYNGFANRMPSFWDRHEPPCFSAPLISELQSWAEATLDNAEPKSALGKALRYILRQWPRLLRFLDDPPMELTNNEVERDLRTWVLNRKTWLFCGHDRSARRAADALTIITTCKKLGHDPRCYIRDTLKRILDGERDLNALLPENYKPGGLLGSAPEFAAA
jgi:hypothetical protein